jgi:hypothetical protein
MQYDSIDILIPFLYVYFYTNYADLDKGDLLGITIYQTGNQGERYYSRQVIHYAIQGTSTYIHTNRSNCSSHASLYNSHVYATKLASTRGSNIAL